MLLKLGGKRAYRYMLRALNERQPLAVDADIHLVVPDYTLPDAAQGALVERIHAAYRRAKQDEAYCDPVFLPQGGWKNVIAESYSSLNEGQTTADRESFHFFLANFGTWRHATGITESHKLHAIAASPSRRLHFEQQVMAEQLWWWDQFERQQRDLSALSLPRFGNQCGVLVDGHFLSVDSVASDVDARLIAGVLVKERPVLAELGGGFGRLAYFISRHRSDFRYIGLDLPECLCCASYYLMQAFPDKRFLLYGEGELSPRAWAEYDFVMLPSFTIRTLPDDSVDLFLNENSLGLMTPAACRYFVQQIGRMAKSFWHRNHEVRRNRFADGTTSLVNQEYPVSRHKFPEVIRYSDVRRFIGPAGWTLENDMYWHLFRGHDDPRPDPIAVL
jgi:putative sugar O-methyltransferase